MAHGRRGRTPRPGSGRSTIPKRSSANTISPTIRKWLEVFLFRFFQLSQYKRSAIPNSPKVSAGGALSPRGDWRAPSDGNAGPWLEELSGVRGVREAGPRP